MRDDITSLEGKLRLLAEGEEIGLTPEEAAIYGVDYADIFPESEEMEVAEDE